MGIDDLVLNLIAETIGFLAGTAATLLIVNRALQRREERRWLPAKSIIFVKLTRITDKLLKTALNSNLHGSAMMYTFGEFTVSGCENFKRVNREEIDVSLKDYPRQTFWLEDIVEAHSEVNNLLDTAVYLLDPETTSLVFNLENELGETANFLELMKGASTAVAPDILSRDEEEGMMQHQVRNALFSTAKLRAHVETKADKTITVEQFWHDYRANVEKLANSVEKLGDLIHSTPKKGK